MNTYPVVFMNQSRREAKRRDPLHFGMERASIHNDQASLCRPKVD